MLRPLSVILLMALGFPLQAAEPCVTLDRKAVAALFDDWNFALSSLDPDQVTQRYWPNAVLLPTLSNTPRTNPAMIADYFEHFLVKRPRGHIDSRTIQTGCNMAMDAGTYTFSLMDEKGSTTNVAARYTFVYQYRDGAWKILHHHSSAMPEVTAPAESHASTDGQADEEKPKPPPEPVKPSRKERRAKWAAPPAARHEMLAAKPGPKPEQKPEQKPGDKAAEKTGAKSDGKAGDKPAEKTPGKSADPSAERLAQKPADAPATPAKEVAATPASSDEKLPPEVRTAMFANLTSAPPPSKFYPAEAARRKEHGSVNLKVCANAEGVVSDSMEVVRSSGSKLLDDAAISWAQAVTWVPATLNRKRVEGCARVDVSFEPPPPGMVQARRS